MEKGSPVSTAPTCSLRGTLKGLQCWKKVRLRLLLTLIIVTDLRQAVRGQWEQGCCYESYYYHCWYHYCDYAAHSLNSNNWAWSGDSEAMKSLPGGLIFEMDVFMAIHSHSPLVPVLVSPVTLMFMNYTHRNYFSHTWGF